MRRVGVLGRRLHHDGRDWRGICQTLARDRTAAGEIGKDLSNFECAIHGMVNINDDKQTAYGEAKRLFQSLLRTDLSAGELDQSLAGARAAERLRST